MQCDEIVEMMSASIDGQLNDAQEEALREHLAQCRKCRTEFESLKQTVALLRGMQTVQPPSDILQRVRSRAGRKRAKVLSWPGLNRPQVRIAVAAGLLAAVCIYGLRVADRSADFSRSERNKELSMEPEPRHDKESVPLPDPADEHVPHAASQAELKTIASFQDRQTAPSPTAPLVSGAVAAAAEPIPAAQREERRVREVGGAQLSAIAAQEIGEDESAGPAAAPVDERLPDSVAKPGLAHDAVATAGSRRLEVRPESAAVEDLAGAGSKAAEKGARDQLLRLTVIGMAEHEFQKILAQALTEGKTSVEYDADTLKKSERSARAQSDVPSEELSADAKDRNGIGGVEVSAVKTLFVRVSTEAYARLTAKLGAMDGIQLEYGGENGEAASGPGARASGMMLIEVTLISPR